MYVTACTCNSVAVTVTACCTSILLPTPAAVQAKLIAPANGEYKTTISSKELLMSEEFPKMSIQVPSELIEMFADSDGNDGVVRAVSYLYYNVESLFPSGLPGDNK